MDNHSSPTESPYLSWAVIVCAVGNEALQQRTKGLMGRLLPGFAVWEQPEDPVFSERLSFLPHTMAVTHIHGPAHDENWGKLVASKIQSWAVREKSLSAGASVSALVLPMTGSKDATAEAQETGIITWVTPDAENPNGIAVALNTIERSSILRQFAQLARANPDWEADAPVMLGALLERLVMQYISKNPEREAWLALCQAKELDQRWAPPAIGSKKPRL